MTSPPYLISMSEYDCMWSWFMRMSGSRSTRRELMPSAASAAMKRSLMEAHENGLHLTIRREAGTARRMRAHRRNTLGVICEEAVGD